MVDLTVDCPPCILFDLNQLKKLRAMKRKNIETAIEVLREAVSDIDRVSEWAAAMGYDDLKMFSRIFGTGSGKGPKS